MKWKGKLRLKNLKKSPLNFSSDELKWVEETYESLTEREKVGQIFIPLAMELERENLDRLLKYHPGEFSALQGWPLVRSIGPVMRLMNGTSIW